MPINKGNDVAHALIFRNQATPMDFEAAWTQWTPDCINKIKTLKDQAVTNYRARTQNEYADLSIPSSSLRMLLQLKIDSLLSVTPYTGFSYSDLNNTKHIKPFALMQQTPSLIADLSSCVESWLSSNVTAFIERHEVADHWREELFELFDEQKLFHMGHSEFKLFPWGQHKNGTAVPQDSNLGYPVAANDIARLLEGKAIFPGLPPVLRVIGGYSNNSNRAELVTPIIDTYEQGRFSMVCSISIETLPTVEYPLIYIDFHRRRWIDSIADSYTHSRSISAYLINVDEDRAYQFKLEKRPNDQNRWGWTADDAWDVLSEKYRLTPSHQPQDLLSILDPSGLSVGVAHQHGIEDRNLSAKNRLGSGVTETDRINAFSQIESELSQYGFEQFGNFTAIKNSTPLFKELAYLDVQTLSNADNNEVDENSDPEQQNAITDEDITQAFSSIDRSFTDAFTSIISDQEQDPNKLKRRKEKVQNMMELNQSLVNSSFTCTDNRKPTIVLVNQDQSQQALLLTITQRLFGESVNVRTALLPEKVHGPKSELPESQTKDFQRLQARKEIWEAFSKNAFQGKTHEMCLIQAHEYYSVASQTKPIHDDRINKPAAKIALASEAGVPTQYLKPINSKIKAKQKQLVDYIHRAQSALLDLVFGHHGLIPGIREQVEKSFGDNNTAPRYLYGINIIKVNKKTVKKGSSELAVATRINSHSGLPEVKLCHFDNSLHITQWLSFNDAIIYITQRYNSSLSLGRYQGVNSGKDNFQKFCREIIDEANTQYGCVFIDSTHSKRLWPWLADTGATTSHAPFSDGSNAKWESARIFRVREQAPPLMIEKFKDDYAVHTTCARLFRVNDGDVPIYWSLGQPLVKLKRGVSTYQETELPESDNTIKSRGPWLKPAPTPNAIEFTLLSHLATDDTDQLACFASALRRGVLQANFDKWIRSPAPIFITNKLEEYLSL